MPTRAASLILLAALPALAAASVLAEPVRGGSGERHAAGQSGVRTGGGGLGSRWTLFGGELAEDLDWLLGSYADLAREFVHGVTPGGFPWDPLIAICTGSDILQSILEILKSEAGILGVSLTLALVGLLLPIAGLLLCLCRCCGHCGAVRREERVRRLACRTGVVMGSFLLLASLAIGAAGCFTILSGERLSQSVTHFEGTVNSIMDDIDEFQSDLISDLRGVGDISYIVDNLGDSLQGAEDTILGPVIKQYDDISGPLNATVTQLQADLSDPLTNLSGIASLLAVTVGQLSADGSAFQTAANAAAASLVHFRDTDCAPKLPNSLYGVCALIPGEAPFLTPLAYSMLDAYNFAPVTIYPLVVDTALGAYSQALSEGAAVLAGVREMVASSSELVQTDMDQVLTEVQWTVGNKTEEVVSGLEEGLGESLDTQAFRDQIGGYVDLVEEYDMYSYVAFLVFASIGFVMSLLCLLGLLFGACGYKGSRRPSQRSNTSECGGKFMTWSMWWTFIFGVVFCLPTAVWFMIGANVTLLCDAMMDLSVLDRVVDNPALWNGQTLLDSVIQLGNSPLNLTARHFIEDCQDDQTLYEALHLASAGLLDSMDSVDIEEFLPFVEGFTANITGQINEVDLGGLTDLSIVLSAVAPPSFPLVSLALSPETLKALTEAVPTQDAIDSLNMFINRTWEGYADHGSSLTEFQEQVDYATVVITELQTLQTLQTNLLTLLDLYENQVNFFTASFYKVQNLTTDAMPSLTANTQDLQDFSLDANSAVITSLNAFVNTIVSDVEEMVNGPIDKIMYDIGHCGVVASAYEATVAEVCQHFLTGFNALWLSTGVISLCCLPIIVLNARLTKYIGRTKAPRVYNARPAVSRDA